MWMVVLREEFMTEMKIPEFGNLHNWQSQNIDGVLQFTQPQILFDFNPTIRHTLDYCLPLMSPNRIC